MALSTTTILARLMPFGAPSTPSAGAAGEHRELGILVNRSRDPGRQRAVIPRDLAGGSKLPPSAHSRSDKTWPRSASVKVRLSGLGFKLLKIARSDSSRRRETCYHRTAYVLSEWPRCRQ